MTNTYHRQELQMLILFSKNAAGDSRHYGRHPDLMITKVNNSFKCFGMLHSYSLCMQWRLNKSNKM